MQKKITLGVIFGGRSVEHEVSILTGYQVIEAAEKDKYNVVAVYLDRDNLWYTGRELDNLDFFRQPNPPLHKLTRVYPLPDPRRGKLRLAGSGARLLRKAVNLEIDCVIPATHGTFVEDGALQGLLEMADVPVAGSGVRASAVGMDKILFKAVLKAENLPHLPFAVVEASSWKSGLPATLERIQNEVHLPCFVKPAGLGSSIGISRAGNHDKLKEAIDLALRFGDRVLVEEEVTGAMEINCAVIDGDPPLPSILEQPVRAEDLLSFDEKYKGNAKKGGANKGGMAGLQRIIPAPLNPERTAQIQALAVRTFQAVRAGGVARIDFLVDPNGQVFINELNNIPGSLAFYLWEHMGRSFSELIDRLVERAFEVQKTRNRLTYSFEANLLAGG